MLDVGVLFDNSFYLASNPDVAAAVAAGGLGSGLAHFEQFGQFENRAPSVLFNPGYYRERYTDVSGVIEAGGTSEFKHFVEFGQFEGRDPNPVFDTNFYLALNPDVAASVAADQITAFEHFVRYGQFEGRNPSIVFDTSFYLTENPDVAAAIASGTIRSAIEHYLTYGLREGRLISPPNFRDDLNAAIELGFLSGTQTTSDFIGNASPVDIYRFILNTPSNLSVLVNGLGADIDVELIEDINGNNVIESEDIFVSSTGFGAAPEAINFDNLPAGIYYVRVSQFEGETNYNLSLSVT